MGWCRPFSFCVRQPFPAAALLPPGQSSAPWRAQCSVRRQRPHLRPRSGPSLEKGRLQSARPLFLLQRARQQVFPQAVLQRRPPPPVLDPVSLLGRGAGIPLGAGLPAPPKRHGQSARQLLLSKLRQPQKISALLEGKALPSADCRPDFVGGCFCAWTFFFGGFGGGG